MVTSQELVLKKILIIGGNCESLKNFRGELIKSFISHKLKVYACAGGGSDHLKSWFNKVGANFIPLPLDRTGVNPFNDIIFFYKLVLIIKKINPDFVLSYTVKPIVYGILASRICKVKNCYALITGLGYSFIPPKSIKHRFVNIIVRSLYKFSLKSIKSVFFQNDDDLNFFLEKKIIPKSVNIKKVNGSGVDLDYFAYKKPHSREDGVNFLLIARLLKDKGIYEYIRAADIIHKIFPKKNISFSILGPFDSNPEAITFEEVQQLKSKKLIKYLGESDDVRPYIEKCSVYVLPSYREGMPRSTLEAMSMGRAIITTDVPGCKETVISGKNGYLVKAKSSQELAKAMIKFIENDKLIDEMGQYSRKLACKKFNVHEINSIMLQEMNIKNYFNKDKVN